MRVTKFWMAIPIGVSFLLSQGHHASAQSVQEFSAACQQDIAKHCANTAGKPAEMQMCLMMNKDKLGEACKKQVEIKR